MVLTPGSASRLTIFVHADARWHYHPLSDEIIQRARRAGVAGASRFAGAEGYGRTRVIHRDDDPDIEDHLPCEIVLVDPSAQRLRAFAVELDGILDHGLVVLDEVEVAAVQPRKLPP
jgi:PII-like signaling protein